MALARPGDLLMSADGHMGPNHGDQGCGHRRYNPARGGGAHRPLRPGGAAELVTFLVAGSRKSSPRSLPVRMRTTVMLPANGIPPVAEEISRSGVENATQQTLSLPIGGWRLAGSLERE